MLLSHNVFKNDVGDRLFDLFVLQWLNSLSAEGRSAVLVDKKCCQMNFLYSGDRVSWYNSNK